jgi:nickel transport protein
MRASVLALAALLLPVPAAAHDLWLERDDTGYVLLYGHRHSGHAGEDTVPYRPEALRKLACFDVTGRQVAEGDAGAYPARLPSACAVAYALLSTGHWTKTPYGTRNVAKDQVDVAVSSWLSFEGVKRVERWSEGLARPLTSDLEIVPLEDPFRLADGDKLRLRVTFRGEPVAGAVVAYDGKPRAETGADGLANVRVRHGGLQSIEATLRRAVQSPQADEEVHTTALGFARHDLPLGATP